MNVTAERLIELRTAKNVTQEEVAEACGISRVTLARYENETRKKPIPQNLSKLAEYYGVSVDYLLGREEAPKETDWGIMRPERPLPFDVQPYDPWPEDKPETRAIIERILAKLAMLDAEGQKIAEEHIDFVLSRQNKE